MLLALSLNVPPRGTTQMLRPPTATAYPEGPQSASAALTLPAVATGDSRRGFRSPAPRRHWVAPLAMTILVVAGCGRPPEPQAEDIAAYARNGAAGAKVRHLGPTVQPYVDQVFKAHNACGEALAPVATLSDPASLWPVDSPNWRNAETVDAQLKTVQQWRAAESERQELRHSLAKAIEAVPAAYRGQAGEITAQVTKVLSARQPQRISEIVRQYEALFALVVEARDGFAPDGSGLEFRDAQTTANARELWSRLHDLVDEVHNEARNDELQQAEWALTDGKQLRATAIEQKQKIDRSSQAAIREMRALDIDIHYYDKVIDDAERYRKKLKKSETENASP